MILTPHEGRSNLRRPRPAERAAGAAAVVLGALLLAGCAARRTMLLTSEPSGATAELDGHVVGVTPVEVPFDHYGVRQVTMTAPGHGTWSNTVKVRAPWFGRFPLDIVSEILLPFGWRDRHKVHAQLEKQVIAVEESDLQAVLARARALRAIMEDGREGQQEPDPRAEPGKPVNPSILPPVDAGAAEPDREPRPR